MLDIVPNVDEHVKYRHLAGLEVDEVLLLNQIGGALTVPWSWKGVVGPKVVWYSVEMSLAATHV